MVPMESAEKSCLTVFHPHLCNLLHTCCSLSSKITPECVPAYTSINAWLKFEDTLSTGLHFSFQSGNFSISLGFVVDFNPQLAL